VVTVAYEETQLYQAVLRQAVADLFTDSAAGGAEEAKRNRTEALLFLTNGSGPWAHMRAEVCLVIDRDPETVRENIIAILDGADLPAYGQIRGQGLEKARALWTEHRPRKAATPAPAPAARPAPVIVRKPRPIAPAIVPKPVASQPAKPEQARGKVITSKKAAKPWLCPPRDPADDWLYGIAAEK
jgi:hypothetical protein